VTFGHVFFIPMMILVGVLLGFILGARAARNQIDLERRREADRAAVRAAREARKAAQASDAGKDA
jgi:hypothetical protein